MNKIRLLIILFVISLSLSSCSNSGDNPSSNNKDTTSDCIGQNISSIYSIITSSNAQTALSNLNDGWGNTISSLLGDNRFLNGTTNSTWVWKTVNNNIIPLWWQ
jgi:hypothetical protein